MTSVPARVFAAFMLAGLGGLGSCQLASQSQIQPTRPCRGGELWSAKYGPGGLDLQDGDFLHVPAGTAVLVDQNTPTLGGLWVEGTLCFADTGDYELRSCWILVTGIFEIGHKYTFPKQPFQHRATVTLAAPPQAGFMKWHDPGDLQQEPRSTTVLQPFDGTNIEPFCLDRGLVVTGNGQLRLFGASRGVSWTQLAETAGKNGAAVQLEADVAGDWLPGDEIVIASTDYAMNQAERRLIDFIDGGGQVVHFDQQLDYEHYGHLEEILPASEWHIPIFGEVANLTRNVVIQGEAEITPDTFGDLQSQPGVSFTHPAQDFGHVILVRMIDGGAYDPDSHPWCDVSWTEFRNLGIEGKSGRYPVHIHELADATALGLRPRFEDNSIHDCHHRFLALHNAENCLVRRNVGCGTLGHGFYMEDTAPGAANSPASSTDNRIEGNLAMLADRLDLRHAEKDEFVAKTEFQEPASFWIVHPDNKIQGNHAAGAAGHGFWLLPVGPEAANEFRWVHHDNFNGTEDAHESFFRNNVAHSNEQHGFYQNIRPRWLNGDAADPFLDDQIPAASGLIAYKNRRYGVWWRTHGRALLTGFKIADCRGGIYPASTGQPQAGPIYEAPGPGGRKNAYLEISDCLIAGVTENRGNWDPADPESLHEQAAGRSLPQRDMHAVELDSPEPHFTPWDLLSGIEMYDGVNDVHDIRFANFADAVLPAPQGSTPLFGYPNPTLRESACITQVDYDSSYGEDPRNSVRNLQFAPGTVQHRVLFRIPPNSQHPQTGAAMLTNTVVVDVDGSLAGLGPNRYVLYHDPAIWANASLAGAPPGNPAERWVALDRALQADFSLIQVTADISGPGTKPNRLRVRIADQSGTARIQDLPHAPDAGNGRFWLFNAITGVRPSSSQDGVYELSYANPSATLPSKIMVEFQMSERTGEVLMIGLPLPSLNAGNPVRINGLPVAHEPGTVGGFATRAQLLAAPVDQHRWTFDPAQQRIWLKLVSALEQPLFAVGVEGTRIAVTINQ